MRKTILAVLAFGLMATTMATAQSLAIYPTVTPEITLWGHFNGRTAGSGLSTAAAMATTVYKYNDQNLFFTKLDTVSNTSTDTFKFKLRGSYNSVYTWMHGTSISGTNTSCTAKLYLTGDSTYLTDAVPVYTVTVGATNPIGYHLINSGNGWPYNSGFWLFTGAGTHSTSIQCGMQIK